VIGRFACQEMAGVALNNALLAFDMVQVVGLDGGYVLDTFQPAARTIGTPAKSNGIPVDGRWSRGQPGFQLSENPLGPADQGTQVLRTQDGLRFRLKCLLSLIWHLFLRSLWCITRNNRPKAIQNRIITKLRLAAIGPLPYSPGILF